MRMTRLVLVSIALALFPASSVAQRSMTAPPAMDGSTGATVFEANCAECHIGETSGRAPRMTTLQSMTARAILTALEDGRMRRHGEELTSDERVAVSEWISGSVLVETRMPPTAFCAARPQGPGTVHSSGWGGSAGETGFVDAAAAGMTAADLPNVELALSLIHI